MKPISFDVAKTMSFLPTMTGNGNHTIKMVLAEGANAIVLPTLESRPGVSLFLSISGIRFAKASHAAQGIFGTAEDCLLLGRCKFTWDVIH